MVKYTLKVNGMMCGMCESHVNDVVRKNSSVKKVTSSHSKGVTVIISEDKLDVEEVKAAIAGQGYEVSDVKEEEYVKKGLFGFLKK